MAYEKTWTTLRGIVAGSLLIGSAVLATPAAFADDDDDDNDVDVVVGIYPAGEVEPLGTPEAVG
jgi:hypothetical protein